jgi:NAD+ synthase (glutamine-hydrolysing)
MRVALAQINPTVGAIDANAAKVAEWIGCARDEGAELVIFPELCIPGYPAEDLYLKRHFLAANQRAIEELARETNGITALVGFAEPVANPIDSRHAHNSIAVLADGAVPAVYRKNRLPNYSVFDEQRYFVPGSEPVTVEAGGLGVGLTVCEDVWLPGGPAEAEAEQGARLIANPSGSPYHRGKGREREEMFCERSRAYDAYFAFCNLVGGQDELVFDGQSLVTAPDGSVIARAAQFEEELLVCEIPHEESGPLAEPLADLDEVYAALTLGLRDYVGKNGSPPTRSGRSGSAASSCPPPTPAPRPSRTRATSAATSAAS